MTEHRVNLTKPDALRIDLTEPGGSLRYAEIETCAGIVRVNVNLVDTRTGRPVVVVEVEPNIPGRAKTAAGGDWEVEVLDHLGFRTDVWAHPARARRHGGRGGHVIMFERYTDRARRALDLAQEEARNLGLLRVGAGHILLGLIGEDGGVAAVALKSLGADLAEARHVMGRSALSVAQAPPGPLPFTSRARGVLDQALRESISLGHPYIATEHLLLALISDSEGSGNDPLVTIGINPGDARAKVMELLHGYEAAEKEPQAPPADDRLAAVLEEIRERYAKAAPGIASNPVVYIDSADDVPRLLAALDAVLKLHTEAVIECKPRPFHYCSRCSGHPAWPCPTVQAITRELTGGREVR